MKIYYDALSGNIVMGKDTRLFAAGALEAYEDRGRVSIRYVGNNYLELHTKFTKILREDGSRAGQTLQEVIDYLNTEFSRQPFQDTLEELAARDARSVSLTSAVALLACRFVTTNSTGLAIYASIDDQGHNNRVVGLTRNAGTTLTVQTSGEFENPGWNWVPTSRLYLGLAGQIVTLPGAGRFTMQVGYAISATRIFIRLGRGIARN